MRQRSLTILALSALFAFIGQPAGLQASLADPDPTEDSVRVAADSVPLDDTPHRLIQDEAVTLEIGARVQVRYSHAFPESGDDEGSFRIRRARLNLSGEAYRHFDYRIQVELAGSGARLLDATIGHTFSPAATLTVGQAKAPFGRQQLVSSTRLQLVDRSIVDGRFSAGRQVGALLSGSLAGEQLEYGLGFYNGEGINVTNQDGSFMQVARLVWTPLGSYSLAESSLDYPETPRLALGVSGMNTVVRAPESDDEIDQRRMNVEAAFKVRGFNGTAELYLEERVPEEGSARDAVGWHTQLAYLLADREHELVARFGAIDPDAEDPSTNERTELAVGVNRYFEGHSAKLQADVVRIEDRTLDTSETQLRVQLQVAL